MGLESLLCVLLVSPLLLQAVTPSPETKEAQSRLHALFDDEWEFRLHEDPLFASAVGDHRFDDLLPSVGIADEARRDGELRKLRRRLLEIDPAALEEADRESWVLMRRGLDDAIRGFELRAYRFPISADSGFHTEFARLADEVPLATTRDYENYIARLRAFPEFARQNTDLLREGLRTGWTLPRAVSGSSRPTRHSSSS